MKTTILAALLLSVCVAEISSFSVNRRGKGSANEKATQGQAQKLENEIARVEMQLNKIKDELDDEVEEEIGDLDVEVAEAEDEIDAAVDNSVDDSVTVDTDTTTEVTEPVQTEVKRKKPEEVSLAQEAKTALRAVVKAEKALRVVTDELSLDTGDVSVVDDASVSVDLETGQDPLVDAALEEEDEVEEAEEPALDPAAQDPVP